MPAIIEAVETNAMVGEVYMQGTHNPSKNSANFQASITHFVV